MKTVNRTDEGPALIVISACREREMNKQEIHSELQKNAT